MKELSPLFYHDKSHGIGTFGPMLLLLLLVSAFASVSDHGQSDPQIYVKAIT